MIVINIAGSSNGRTRAFGAYNERSIRSPAARKKNRQGGGFLVK